MYPLTISELISHGVDILKKNNIESPVLNAGVILCHVLKCDRIFIYSHGDKCVDISDIKVYNIMIGQRASGKPLQYIIGKNEFMSLPFVVTPDVLIPRPETELLVEQVIKFSEGFNEKAINILDIGTGSGCIAICLAFYIKNALVTALDVSENALGVARQNALNLGVSDRMTFVESNLFNNLYEYNKFDVIASNPPYIPSSDIELLQAEVKEHEPHTALDGGEDGLFFYRAIIKQSTAYLKPNGFLILEVGIGQAAPVTSMMNANFSNINVFKDLSGIDRVVSGIRK